MQVNFHSSLSLSFLNAHHSFTLDSLFTNTMQSMRKFIFFLTNSSKSSQYVFLPTSCPTNSVRILGVSRAPWFFSIILYPTLNPAVPFLNLSYSFPFLLISTLPLFSSRAQNYHLFTSFSVLHVLHFLVPSLSPSQTGPSGIMTSELTGQLLIPSDPHSAYWLS